MYVHSVTTMQKRIPNCQTGKTTKGEWRNVKRRMNIQVSCYLNKSPKWTTTPCAQLFGRVCVCVCTRAQVKLICWCVHLNHLNDAVKKMANAKTEWKEKKSQQRLLCSFSHGSANDNYSFIFPRRSRSHQLPLCVRFVFRSIWFYLDELST